MPGGFSPTSRARRTESEATAARTRPCPGSRSGPPGTGGATRQAGRTVGQEVAAQSREHHGLHVRETPGDHRDPVGIAVRRKVAAEEQRRHVADDRLGKARRQVRHGPASAPLGPLGGGGADELRELVRFEGLALGVLGVDIVRAGVGRSRAPRLVWRRVIGVDRGRGNGGCRRPIGRPLGGPEGSMDRPRGRRGRCRGRQRHGGRRGGPAPAEGSSRWDSGP